MSKRSDEVSLDDIRMGDSDQIARLKVGIRYTRKIERCGDCKYFKCLDPDKHPEDANDFICVRYPKVAFQVDYQRGRCKKYEDYT